MDPESTASKQPAYVKGIARSIKPELFVVEGVCTHLGCSPTLKKEVGAASDMGADWPGGGPSPQLALRPLRARFKAPRPPPT